MGASGYVTVVTGGTTRMSRLRRTPDAGKRRDSRRDSSVHHLPLFLRPPPSAWSRQRASGRLQADLACDQRKSDWPGEGSGRRTHIIILGRWEAEPVRETVNSCKERTAQRQAGPSFTPPLSLLYRGVICLRVPQARAPQSPHRASVFAASPCHLLALACELRAQPGSSSLPRQATHSPGYRARAGEPRVARTKTQRRAENADKTRRPHEKNSNREGGHGHLAVAFCLASLDACTAHYSVLWWSGEPMNTPAGIEWVGAVPLPPFLPP
ncbi:hypothetical protein CSOJ01_06249 [Colletotrichum sojae]|uniref:Uncharacterized protein n=1 Tax=Colletotrichum sojae TaxID=2175907 RepID=A0A8H6JDG1_9PEZI|nr:hypothetical protein CSOJ01_06249 [Colletotrichum sojae]